VPHVETSNVNRFLLVWVVWVSRILNCPLHFGSAYTFIAFIHNSGSNEVHQASVKEGEGASE